MTASICQNKRGKHEYDRCAGGHLAHESAAAPGTEHRLTSAGTERRPHLCTFAGLEKDDGNQGDADSDVNDNKKNGHMLFPLRLMCDFSFYHSTSEIKS